MLKWLWIIAVSVLLSWQTPAFAGPDVASATTDVITRIQDEGYTVTKITKTWLGRILVTAHNDNFLREVVVNRHSGDILRDSLFRLPGSDTRIASPDLGGNRDGFEDNGQISSVGRAQGRLGNHTATGESQPGQQASAASDNNTDTTGTTGTDTEAASNDAVGDTSDTDSVGAQTGGTDAGDTGTGDAGTGDAGTGDAGTGDTDTDAGDTDAGDTGAGTAGDGTE